MTADTDANIADSLSQLTDRLANSAGDLDSSGKWPTEQLKWCSDSDVFRWFVPSEFGGLEWDNRAISEGYLALASSCLTTTFVLTQWNAACKRIINSENADLKARILPAMAAGDTFATVGISHLTTSRQHVAPVLTATRTPTGYVLNGLSPWVTGAPKADLLVVGATQSDGDQILAAVPATRQGVKPAMGSQLVALSGSLTDQVEFEQVEVHEDEIIAGPKQEVLKQKEGSGAGGLQTSTLAIGLASAAGNFLKEQADRRPELSEIAAKLNDDIATLSAALLELASGEAGIPLGELREQANSLALRSTQAALQAAKGAGFLASHPTGRWAREAMFFLVWSCPQAVAQANMCELAQLN